MQGVRDLFEHLPLPRQALTMLLRRVPRIHRAEKIIPTVVLDARVFFGASRENHQNDEFGPRWKRGRETVSDFY